MILLKKLNASLFTGTKKPSGKALYSTVWPNLKMSFTPAVMPSVILRSRRHANSTAAKPPRKIFFTTCTASCTTPSIAPNLPLTLKKCCHAFHLWMTAPFSGNTSAQAVNWPTCICITKTMPTKQE